MNTNLTFKLNKIAFNNSCNSNFVSLSFEENTHISGRNGSGKSSKLNGVQLGFLPQVTFKNSNKHFYFKSSKGNFYKDEECYDFYFPYKNSFIIYEFSNPDGTFCQILYKGNQELSIERAFVPLSFEEIYHWFWKFPEGDELGFPTNITRTELKEKINSIKGSKTARNKSEAIKILYNNEFNSESSRYSIANVNEKRINNVIDIFKLTSNASEIDRDLLKKTLVSLLDTSYKDNKRDVTGYDPIQIMQEFERLEEERNAIKKKQNFEGLYLELKENFSNIIEKSRILKEKYQSCLDFNSKKIETNRELLSQRKKARESEMTELNKIKKEGQELKNNYQRLEGAVNVRDGIYRKNKALLNKYNEIFSPEHDSGLHVFKEEPERAIDYLTEIITENQKEIKKYENMDKVEKDLRNDKSMLESLNTKLQNKEKQLLNNKNLLLSNNNINNPSILNTLNSAFSSIENKLDENQISVLNNLTNLFTIENNRVYLLDNDFGSLKEFNFSVEEIKKEIEDLKDNIQLLKSKINKNSKVMSENPLENKNKLISETKKAKNEKDIIFKGQELISEIISIKKELDQDLEQLDIAKEKHKNHQDKYRELQKLKEEKDHEYKYLEKESEKAQNYLRELNILRNSNNYQYIRDENLRNTLVEVTDNDIDCISKLFKDVQGYKNNIISNLNTFVEEGIVSDDNALLKISNVKISELKENLFDKLEHIYTTIEESEDSFNKAFNQHANTTIELSKSLKNQIDYFKNYLKKINESMKDFKLSSIDEMRVAIKFNPKIENFIKTISNTDLESDDAVEALDKGLSDKIKNFITDMGLEKSKTMQINTESMIESVSFEYNIQGEWTTKDGSTGTSTVASVMLLSIFIKEICGENINLSIPVNLDETGNIDHCNIVTLNDFLKAQNLVLFSASPEPQISSEDIFKVLINFDDSYVYEDDRLLNSKHRSTYHYKMKSILNEEVDIKVVDFE